MSTFGKNLEVSIFGASHEKYIGLTIHNLPGGIKLDLDLIKERLKLRLGLAHLTSLRIEEEEFEIISGYLNNFTTGAPLTILIKNKDIKSSDYESIKDTIRPSHADYSYHLKYKSFHDYRGGGVSSGRLTACLIVLGAISEQILRDKNIIIASRIKQIKNLVDLEFNIEGDKLKALKEEAFPVVDLKTKEAMLELIKKTREEKNSLAGIVETFIMNPPTGLGEPFFDSFESILSHLIYSIPGVKGLEFGLGFDFINYYGSEVNDELSYDKDKVKLHSNNNAGINGGVTNGEVINFKTIFKPTPSIGSKQKTINLKKKTNEELEMAGRHDVIIAVKGLHVVNAITNYVVLELLLRSKQWDF